MNGVRRRLVTREGVPDHRCGLVTVGVLLPVHLPSSVRPHSESCSRKKQKEGEKGGERTLRLHHRRRSRRCGPDTSCESFLRPTPPHLPTLLGVVASSDVEGTSGPDRWRSKETVPSSTHVKINSTAVKVTENGRRCESRNTYTETPGRQDEKKNGSPSGSKGRL